VAKRTFYHVSPAVNRESILQHGLDRSRGAQAWPSDYDYPPGIYLFGDLEDAWLYRMDDLRGVVGVEAADIYEVELDEDDLLHDPGVHANQDLWYVDVPVPRSNVRLLEPAKHSWRTRTDPYLPSAPHREPGP
jgi:hypothetical protein